MKTNSEILKEWVPSREVAFEMMTRDIYNFTHKDLKEFSLPISNCTCYDRLSNASNSSLSDVFFLELVGCLGLFIFEV